MSFVALGDGKVPEWVCRPNEGQAFRAKSELHGEKFF
jgi:hypothetical protein